MTQNKDAKTNYTISFSHAHVHAFTPHLACPHIQRVPEKKPDTHCAHQHNLHGHGYTLTAVSFLLCPPQNNTHRHTLAQSLASGHLAFPLTCNFRHRCAGRTHTHAAHSDRHYKFCDRKHMFTNAMSVMTIILMCTPALRRMDRQHKHTAVSPSTMYAASCKSLWYESFCHDNVCKCNRKWFRYWPDLPSAKETL